MARVEHSSRGFERSKDDNKDRYGEHGKKDKGDDGGEDRRDS
jgi:hypothetical protein